MLYIMLYDDDDTMCSQRMWSLQRGGSDFTQDPSRYPPQRPRSSSGRSIRPRPDVLYRENLAHIHINACQRDSMVQYDDS